MSEVILYTTDDGHTRIERATVNQHLTVQQGFSQANRLEFDTVIIPTTGVKGSEA